MRRSIKRMQVWFGRACGSAARGEDGAELVEFALSSWILLMFMFGIIELCLVIFAYNAANEAARDTARWLSVRGANVYAGTISSADIIAHVQAIPGAAQMTPTVQWCTDSATCSPTPTSANTAAESLVQVQVQYVYTSVPFISKGSLAATSTTQMVIWQ